MEIKTIIESFSRLDLTRKRNPKLDEDLLK